MELQKKKEIKFDLTTPAGIVQAYEFFTTGAANETLPMGNVAGGIRGVNGVVRLAEMQLRYKQFLIKVYGPTGKPIDIPLLAGDEAAEAKNGEVEHKSEEAK